MRDHLEASPGLWLRRWSEGDARAVLTAFADPLMREQARDPVASPGDAERWLAWQLERWRAGTAFAFAVVDEEDTVLGHVAVSAIDRRHSTGWVSYWTTRAARGGGVASGACRSLARWAFDDSGLFRLELGHRVNNPASCRVAGAAGFAVEGLQRQKLEYDGVRHDVETHARLATDPEPAEAGRPARPPAA
ncbi:GNAT family N-acetyltransferase [Streptomyces sp. CL12]|uniref:GNAT family N-acetyltransferase n=1 Tax=Streptomyces sp. CL12 TaxID=3391744 RepID=UPI003A803393